MKNLTLILLSFTLLQGCAAVVVGAGVTAASAAHDRRTLGTQLDDSTLEAKVSSRINKIERLKEQAHINVEVFNGVALLTGQAPDSQARRQAQLQAQAVTHIKKVHNQIRIGAPTAASTRTHDVWLASKIKTNLVTNERVDGLHIKVIVEDSEVFLMGLVSRQEADVAVDIVRNINGVARVVKAFEYV
ncbi:uncharacterized protein HMF8227_02486 [Saliniradius amylolyticus]|uniref:BON domain-containing protein n=1 Tax=Saliniradius amylolyticus TaxID=2183582 RepID=A0A2S2E5J7_9ALTE|nr:division/outer membrane stress-associated lipid-binding lipoprotein [Saliniradius amylolyticus]AWL12938.1 uncharacterized protein HMF8227_02486 [Saliniradius amylolyticus]